MKRYLAFDIGGTNVKYGIVSEEGSIIEKGIYNTNVDSSEEFIEDIISIYNKFKGKVDGIAIAMPGYIDAERGIPKVCYAINVMEGKSIKEILEDKTGVKVEVENDANCVALAEKFNGNAKECTDFVCITVGTGIGGGIFCNNRILRGSNFAAGEFGFMITTGYNKDKKFDVFSTNSSTSSLINRYKAYKNIDANINISGETVFNERKVDTGVESLIEDWYRCLAIGILNLSATLNPQKVLLGGAISTREEFISEIKYYLEEIPWWNDVKCEIDICKHRNDAGLIGAVYNFSNN